MSNRPDSQEEKLDLAARAAWLYYIDGKTQDQIASTLHISRPAAQRLVALAVSEKLIKFRLDHPIAACMNLAQALQDRFELTLCDVVPGDPSQPAAFGRVALAAGTRLEQAAAQAVPVVLALGTGRTLRAAVAEVSPMNRPQHKIISRVGNMTRDGSASAYDVVMRLADRIGGQRYPLPMPVVADTEEERALLQAQRSFRVLQDLAAQAKETFVGIAEIGWNAPMHRDGFITDAELTDLSERGAVGEITGWAFDEQGHLLDGSVNARVVSLPLGQPAGRRVVAVGNGPAKVAPIRAALRGRLITGLITDELTAEAVLAS